MSFEERLRLDMTSPEESRLPFLKMCKLLALAADYLQDAGRHLEIYGSLDTFTEKARAKNDILMRDVDVIGGKDKTTAVNNLIQSVWNTTNWPGKLPLRNVLGKEKEFFEKMWGPEGALYDNKAKWPGWMMSSWNNHQAVMKKTAIVQDACARLLSMLNSGKEN